MVIVIRRGFIFLILGMIILLIAISISKTIVPAASFNHENIRTIIIDPGHGNPDGGAVGKNSVESQLNLSISLKLRQELEERGFKVIMTREDENGLNKKKKNDMNMRLDIMKTIPSDMFISIHMNKFSKPQYRGGEVYYSSNFIQSTLLAQLIMDEIKKIDPLNQTRGIKESERSLFLMKNATVPAVIIECGFLSNAEEEKLLMDDKYQSRMASAICDGIVKYYENITEFEEINLIKSEATT